MTLKRLLYLIVGLILLGGIIAALWLYAIGGTEIISAMLQAPPAYVAYTIGGTKIISAMLQAHPAYVAALLCITVYFILMRFIRWQFLLRRADVRLPTRPSMSIYLASLVGTATPAYLGEIIRSLLIRQKFDIPIRMTVVVLIGERMLDIIALAVISLFTVELWWLKGLMVGIIIATALFGIVVGNIARRLGVPTSVLTQLDQMRSVLPAFGLSLAIWLPTAFLVTLAAGGLDAAISPVVGVRIFSTATIFGGITLMPAGVGSTGSLAILQLQALGISAAASVVIISLVRLVSVGFTLLVSTVFMVSELRSLRHAKDKHLIHFDEIATEYGNQFSEHIWDHLLARKTNLMADALPHPPAAAGLGLDLGCGLGKQCLTMNKRGFRVIGLDPAQNLVRQAHQAGADTATADALKLPFQEHSLDFVYTVGVLHHLPGVDAQAQAYREVARVLKPGGLFIIHETNPRNPLFRFYMGYIFPLLKSIDEGIEWWIEPAYWENSKQLKLINLHYFTFLPDFIPQILMRPLLGLQRWLESSRLRPYSVHYMAVVQKESLGARLSVAAKAAPQPVPAGNPVAAKAVDVI